MEEPIFCDNCQCEIEDGMCECPPPVIKTIEVPVTYNVKVKVHADCRYGWASFPTIEEAIKAWSFGVSRCGAHHWDKEFCHVAEIKDSEDPNEKWALLYL